VVAIEVIATLTRPDDVCGLDGATGDAGVTCLEVRADLIGDLDPQRLRRHFPGPLAYVLRSRARGGRCDDPPAVRRRRLADAAGRYDVVELEADHDLDPELLSAVPADRRRVSWHGPGVPLGELRDRFDAMAAVPAAHYLLAPAAVTAAGALTPLRLLAKLGRRDVTAYGTGPAGAWSRLLAPWLGAPTVAGRLAGMDQDDGAPAVASLGTDYPFPGLPPLRELYGLIGRVALGSSFPRINNRAYVQRGVPALFLPFHLSTVDDFLDGFWPEVPNGLRDLGLPLRGLSVSAPLKEAALRVADEATASARAAGAANALLRQGGCWRAETTDGTAVALMLRRAGVALEHRPVAVVGCGGAGRAATVALKAAGAAVTLVNRDESRGRPVANSLGVPFVPLASFTAVGCAVVVNATPVQDEVLFPLENLDARATVVDFVSTPAGTALVAEGRRRGLHTIDGRAVTAAEAAEQFRLMTGRTMPSPSVPPSDATTSKEVSHARAPSDSP
jgi:3-dehydroquinate dehydratase/shikimate dehydrogenase